MNISTIDDAEAAWHAALTAPNSDEAMRALLHPDFLVVHGPVGHVHDVDQLLAGANARGPADKVDMLDVRVRGFGETTIVTCIQEMHVAMQPGIPPFVIQASVTRVWVRAGDGFRLAHLQMARRFPPN
jgi:hypothetical protein